MSLLTHESQDKGICFGNYNLLKVVDRKFLKGTPNPKNATPKCFVDECAQS